MVGVIASSVVGRFLEQWLVDFLECGRSFVRAMVGVIAWCGRSFVRAMVGVIASSVVSRLLEQWLV